MTGNASDERGRSRRWLMLLASVSIALGLVACSGDDGEDGAAGPPGVVTLPASVVDSDNITVEVTSAKISSPPVVNFSVSTIDGGIAVTGLPASAVRFYVLRLVPQLNNEASYWVNYIGGPTNPGSETATAGTLVDHGDGTYTYTFATDISQDPNYDPNLTHRISLEFRGFEVADGEEAEVDNAYIDFVPAGGPVTVTRNVVTTDACNTCHFDLGFHGGPRKAVENCVSCHAQGLVDAETGNPEDLASMIHGIHSANSGLRDSTPYVIVRDFRGTVTTYDFSHVVYPQDIRNCTTCHVASVSDSDNWRTVATKANCGSCHADFFAANPEHGDAHIDNSKCTTCHIQGGPAGAIEEDHVIQANIEAQAYQYNILAVTGGAPGTAPVMTFSVTDPTNGNAPYDLTATPELYGVLRATVAWNTANYTNDGNGQNEAQPVRTNISDGTTGALLPGVVDNGDGTYDVTLGTVDASATGTGTVTLEGHPNDATWGSLAVRSAVEFFPITDAEAVPRRDVVAIGQCNVCHGQLALHGANRVDNIQDCVTCHNPNATDRARRPGADQVVTTEIDGKAEEAIDFKYMIHAIHSANIVVYGYGGSVNDFTHVGLPQSASNCRACHDGDTFYPISSAVLGTTVNSGADRTSAADNLRISPTASVCSACHVPASERDNPASTWTAKVHMEQNGANFAMADGDPVNETCGLCHGPGRVSDVAVMHRLERE